MPAPMASVPPGDLPGDHREAGPAPPAEATETISVRVPSTLARQLRAEGERIGEPPAVVTRRALRTGLAAMAVVQAASQ